MTTQQHTQPNCLIKMADSKDLPQPFSKLERGQPVCLPLKTWAQVQNWLPGRDLGNVSTCPLPDETCNPSPLPSRHRTLVCHDMKGGYIDDRFTQGCNSSDCYRFSHWEYVDLFVYFSHEFVTIPPPSWTNAAHSHSVLMLGTIITEWKDGKRRCKDFLESDKTIDEFVEKLVQIAVYYKFDGWLINIENVIKENKINAMVDFVKKLTKEMHEKLPWSQVVWYDSIITTGALEWQNELNEKNQCFFDVCDGMFLNYTWKDGNLQQSSTLAKSVERPYDVYVGVDVFGRGCRGGGGFNTKEAVEVVREMDMSVALFAQGWVYEKFPEDFSVNEDRFWRLLSHLNPTHPTSVTLPLVTNFCQGRGSKFYVLGKAISNDPWTNLTMQNIQAFAQSEIEEENRMLSSITTAYVGGGCIEITNNNIAQNKSWTLLETDIEISSDDDLLVSYTYKIKHEYLDKKPKVAILLDLSQDEGNKIYGLGDDYSSTLYDNTCSDTIAPMENAEEIKSNFNFGYHESDNEDWVTLYYKAVRGRIQGKLKKISLVISGNASDDPAKNAEVSIYLGQIRIMPAKIITQLPSMPKDVYFEGKTLTDVSTETSNATTKYLQGVLGWDFKNELSNLSTFFISYKVTEEGDDWIFHGQTKCPAYQISTLEIPVETKKMYFQIAECYLGSIQTAQSVSKPVFL